MCGVLEEREWEWDRSNYGNGRNGGDCGDMGNSCAFFMVLLFCVFFRVLDGSCGGVVAYVFED
jgi:hypothetical protein